MFRSMFSYIKKNVAKTILLLLALGIMATPVFANSSNWSFLMYYVTRVVDGGKNGVYHTMTAGNMNLQGSVQTTAKYGNPPPAYPLTFEVWNKNGGFLGFPVKICVSNPVTPRDALRDPQPFSKSCGSQPAGTYFLYISRSNAGDREVTGDGTLTTQ